MTRKNSAAVWPGFYPLKVHIVQKARDVQKTVKMMDSESFHVLVYNAVLPVKFMHLSMIVGNTRFAKGLSDLAEK